MNFYRKLLNAEQEPFARNIVFDDVIFKFFIIILVEINHSNQL